MTKSSPVRPLGAFIFVNPELKLSISRSWEQELRRGILLSRVRGSFLILITRCIAYSKDHAPSEQRLLSAEGTLQGLLMLLLLEESLEDLALVSSRLVRRVSAETQEFVDEDRVKQEQWLTSHRHPSGHLAVFDSRRVYGPKRDCDL